MKKLFLKTVLSIIVVSFLSACGEKKSETNTESSDTISVPVLDTTGLNNTVDESQVTVNPNTEDWDAVLSEYESYTDQYIKLMKEAKAGDMSAMSEYASMMEKATALSDKMSSAGGELSASQLAKFTKLQTKLASAAANL